MPSKLAALAAEGAKRALSYEPVGISLESTVQPGHHRLNATRDLGIGDELYTAGRAAIESWVGHKHAGAILEPVQPDLVVGTGVALALRAGPVWVTALCRVVVVIDQADRFGFAYGTLAHHPAQGEEAFLVTRDPGSGVVRFEVRAHSRPQSTLARLGGPVGRQFQQLMARRYLDGFEATARTNR